VCVVAELYVTDSYLKNIDCYAKMLLVVNLYSLSRLSICPGLVLILFCKRCIKHFMRSDGINHL